ncbi:MAG TPA: OB-fold domain-containing protein [Streptosporangiaceae bacterium]|jgi:hypothetical protein
MTAPPRPVPDAGEPELAGYWEGVSRGVLQVPQCPNCGVLRWPPRSACPACGVVDFSWTAVPSTGTLHSYAVVNRAFHPAFADDVPYILAVVQVAPGVRFLGRLTDMPADGIRLGAPVTAEFTDVAGSTLVYWRPTQPNA